MFHGQNVYYLHVSLFRAGCTNPTPKLIAVDNQPDVLCLTHHGQSLWAINVSQIIHLFPDANNIYTPGYTIYKNRNPTRLALFNFNTDPSGFSYYNVTFAIGGSRVNFCVVLYCTICCIQRQLPVGTGQTRFVCQWC